jgi:hypothetical protein
VNPTQLFSCFGSKQLTFFLQNILAKKNVGELQDSVLGKKCIRYGFGIPIWSPLAFQHSWLETSSIGEGRLGEANGVNAYLNR